MPPKATAKKKISSPSKTAVTSAKRTGGGPASKGKRPMKGTDTGGKKRPM